MPSGVTGTIGRGGEGREISDSLKLSLKKTSTMCPTFVIVVQKLTYF